jgi:hypothetical protein
MTTLIKRSRSESPVQSNNRYPLDRFLYRKEIEIDDSGWGDLILGVVIGAHKLPDHKYMDRRIPVSSFQPPKFEKKQYLDDAVKIADEILKVMHPDMETRFKVCSGFILSGIREHLAERGFHVEKVEITGELQELVERSYIQWCKDVGVPVESLRPRTRFWTFLNWVKESPIEREKLVKTGWKSWNQKWREEAYKTHTRLAHPSQNAHS